MTNLYEILYESILLTISVSIIIRIGIVKIKLIAELRITNSPARQVPSEYLNSLPKNFSPISDYPIIGF